MSLMFSRSKKKRTHSSTEDSSSSFVKNVTARVTGFLPSTIKKWFSSPSTSNGNKSASTGDASNSSSDDEGPGSPSNIQPPTKRMRFNTPPVNYSQFGASYGSSVLVNNSSQRPSFSIIQSAPRRSTLRRKASYMTQRFSMQEPAIEIPDDSTYMFGRREYRMSPRTAIDIPDNSTYMFGRREYRMSPRTAIEQQDKYISLMSKTPPQPTDNNQDNTTTFTFKKPYSVSERRGRVTSPLSRKSHSSIERQNKNIAPVFQRSPTTIAQNKNIAPVFQRSSSVIERQGKNTSAVSKRSQHASLERKSGNTSPESKRSQHAALEIKDENTSPVSKRSQHASLERKGENTSPVSKRSQHASLERKGKNTSQVSKRSQHASLERKGENTYPVTKKSKDTSNERQGDNTSPVSKKSQHPSDEKKEEENTSPVSKKSQHTSNERQGKTTSPVSRGSQTPSNVSTCNYIFLVNKITQTSPEDTEVPTVSRRTYTLMQTQGMNPLPKTPFNPIERQWQTYPVSKRSEHMSLERQSNNSSQVNKRSQYSSIERRGGNTSTASKRSQDTLTERQGTKSSHVSKRSQVTLIEGQEENTSPVSKQSKDNAVERQGTKSSPVSKRSQDSSIEGQGENTSPVSKRSQDTSFERQGKNTSLESKKSHHKSNERQGENTSSKSKRAEHTVESQEENTSPVSKQLKDTAIERQGTKSSQVSKKSQDTSIEGQGENTSPVSKRSHNTSIERQGKNTSLQSKKSHHKSIEGENTSPEPQRQHTAESPEESASEVSKQSHDTSMQRQGNTTSVSKKSHHKSIERQGENTSPETQKAQHTVESQEENTSSVSRKSQHTSNERQSDNVTPVSKRSKHSSIDRQGKNTPKVSKRSHDSSIERQKKTTSPESSTPHTPNEEQDEKTTPVSRKSHVSSASKRSHSKVKRQDQDTSPVSKKSNTVIVTQGENSVSIGAQTDRGDEVTMITEEIFVKPNYILLACKSTQTPTYYVETPVKIERSRNPPMSPRFNVDVLCAAFRSFDRTHDGDTPSYFASEPNIRQRRSAYVQQSPSSHYNTMSMGHSTRKIMNLIDQFSSPLAEARRIPPYVKSTQRNSLDTSMNSTMNATKIAAYKTRELYIPSIASILRLKKQSRLIDTTKAARQIIASHSSAIQDFSPYPTASKQKENTDNEQGSNLTTKMKTAITRTNRGDKADEVVAPIQLPTGILQIDKNNMPKFTLGKQFSSASTSDAPAENQSGSSGPENATSSSEFLSKPDLVISSAEFKFSSPVKVSTEHSSQNTPPKFTFGSPERGVDKVTLCNKESYLPFVGSTKETHVRESTENSKGTVSVWTTCGDGAVPESRENPRDPVKTTIDNAVIKSQNSVITWTSKQNQEKKEEQHKNDKQNDNAASWKCAECWVDNKSDIDQCLCCGSTRPSDVLRKPKCTVCKLSDQQANSDKCKQCQTIESNKICVDNGNKWKCEDCYVLNEDSADKCVCCGGSNSKKTVAPPKVVPITDETKKWKCNECWVMNEEGTNNCACCGAAGNVAGNVTGNVAGNVAGVSNASAPIDDWKCDGCWVTNKGSSEKCVACGGSKPGTKTNTPLSSDVTAPIAGNWCAIATAQKIDTWECKGCLVKNNNDKTSCVCCGVEKDNLAGSEKQTFNFGINKNTSFKFGINPVEQQANLAVKTAESNTTKTIPEVPKVTTAEKIPTFTFTLPTKKPTDKTSEAKSNIEAPKLSFNFGIPKASTTPAPAEVQINKPIEKAIEQPKINAPMFNNPGLISDMFKTSDKQSVSASAPTSLPTFGLKPLSAITLPTPSTASSEIFQPKTAFTFSAGSANETKTMFMNPASSATTTMSFTMPVQTTSTVVTSTPAMFQSKEFSSPAFKATTSTTLFQTPESGKSQFQTSLTSPMFQNPTANSTMFQKQDNNTSSSPMFPVSNTPAISTVGLFANNEIKTTTAPSQALVANAPVFSFGANTSFTASSTPAEKPKFNFSFGKTDNFHFENKFASIGNSNAAKSFALPTNTALPPNGLGGNTMSGGNVMLGNNAMGGNNILGNTTTQAASAGNTGMPMGNTMNNDLLKPGNGMAGNVMGSGNGMPTTNNTGGFFGQPSQNENMWGANNQSTNNNMFPSNTAPNPMQKPAAFTFGATSSSPFSGNNASSVFGNNAQPPQNIFGMSTPQNPASQPTMFSSPVQNQSTPNIFGNPAPATNSMGLFGTPNAAPAPQFGNQNQSMPSMATAPAFNFSASSPGVFGFGQQQQPQQQLQQPQQQAVQQAPSMYNFGGIGGNTPQVQFNLGTAPMTNTAGRKVRKAIRRNPPR